MSSVNSSNGYSSYQGCFQSGVALETNQVLSEDIEIETKSLEFAEEQKQAILECIEPLELIRQSSSQFEDMGHYGDF